MSARRTRCGALRRGLPARAAALVAAAVVTASAPPAYAEDDLTTQASAAGWQVLRKAAEQNRPGLPDDTLNLRSALPRDLDACHGGPLQHDGRGPKPVSDAANLIHGGDVAFWGRRAFVVCGADSGHLRDDGFAVVDIKDPTAPEVVSRFSCVASSSDIAVWGDLVFLTADTNNDALIAPTGDDRRRHEYRSPVVGTGTPCNEDIAGWTPGTRQPEFVRGVRVVSVSDPLRPRLITTILAPKHEKLGQGPHNLTVVPELDYVNAQGEPEPRVVVLMADPGAGPTWMIAAPLDPAKEHRVDLVRDANGKPRAWAASSCQDIAVFLPRRIAACNQNLAFQTTLLSWTGSVVDAAKLDKPLKAPVPNRNIPFHNPHHSSAFSWDGDRILITPETYLPNPTCRQDGGDSTLGLYVYDISRLDEPRLVGHHVRPPVVGSTDFCTAKQLNVIPLKSGRDVAVVSWLGGGTSVVDFTTQQNSDGSYQPTAELARFLAEPGGSNKSYAWASHWYEGHVYVNNAFGCAFGAGCVGSATRGLDILLLELPEPALAADVADAVKLGRFSFGLQECHEGLMEQPWAAHLTGCRD